MTSKELILHIGVPRTATTTLQNHVFPRGQSYVYLGKDSVSIQAKPPGKGKSGEALLGMIEEFRQPLVLEPSTGRFGRKLEQALFWLPILVSLQPDEKRTALYEQLLLACRSLRDAAIPVDRYLLSQERFSITRGTYRGEGSSPEAHPPFVWLCRAWQEVNGIAPRILVCLRDPVQHMVSRYLRYAAFQVSGGAESALRPVEYLEKQFELHRSNPHGSLFTTLFHRSFLRYCCDHGFVRAVGYEDLVASDNVFALLGLVEQERISFHSLPRENPIGHLFPEDRIREIRRLMKRTLKAHGFFEPMLHERLLS